MPNDTLIDRLVRCSFIADWLLLLAVTANQRRPSLTHDIWKFQTKHTVYALSLTSALGISTYIGPLLRLYQ